MYCKGLLHTCGKSKTIHYHGSKRDEFVVSFLDSATSYTYQKNELVQGTGNMRCEISSFLFGVLEERGMATHYISHNQSGQMLVKPLEMIKLEIIVRNYAAGSIVRNYPIQHGQPFNPPILKLDMKFGNDPMLNSDYIFAMNIATPDELKLIRELAFEVNSTLASLFKEHGILLVDFKFEVGRTAAGEIVIGDEISPDGMRLWDVDTLASIDKDVFRFGSGDLLEKYKEVAERIMGVMA
ncbi:phosphoribosylaminoimidazolesuccinocarboxamide synthase [Paenibacillus aquistagni]|uniref:phosphoribosylaminoimidazolesuccinocarboxamide synthase n=1 Tax=Paenibacillus aquistagni TaxID=1852522 RepID=UPI00145B905E|nr:phosphoribosylaminoimidazolesuccinocarboxamide synthase [Paenibacillus aquistagni]NMM53336.1 phosphoribosylaminoimidazolesuccinocarboxamide synthase [Paenibacillus aquistagni]